MIRLINDIDEEGIVIVGFSQSHAGGLYRNGELEVEHEGRVGRLVLFAYVHGPNTENSPVLENPPQEAGGR